MNKVMTLKSRLFECIENSYTIIIAGHIRPDGDCIGACLALNEFINNKFPNKSIEICLDNISELYSFLSMPKNITNTPKHEQYDLVISLDCGDKERLGEIAYYFDTATYTINIDHHISNNNYGQYNCVKNISSASELIYEILEGEKLNRKIAEALYTGIVYDTGVFKHTTTTQRTLEVAGQLLNYDIDFSNIIDKLFCQKTIVQNKLLGKALINSNLVLQDKLVYSTISKEESELLGAKSEDTEGIIDQLRATKGVECAFFLYEIEDDYYKVSLRSNSFVDVCEVAKNFDGGGHKKASGCMIKGKINTIIEQLIEVISKQLN